MIRRSIRRSFTLAELVVVMGIVAIIATITVIAVAQIADDARLSSARNAVVAALETARSHAMENNRLTMVVFPAHFDPDEPEEGQHTDIVICEWLGETVQTPDGRLKDRFIPVKTLARRELPPGIKVAGPWYDLGSQSDFVWVTQPEFKPMISGAEVDDRGRMIGIVYGPAGDIRTQTAESGGDDSFVDFNLDGFQNCQSCSVVDLWQYTDWNIEGQVNNKENNIELMPYVAVYDDAAAREELDSPFPNDIAYSQLVGAQASPGGWIRRNADRIHFNRYSGAVLR